MAHIYLLLLFIIHVRQVDTQKDLEAFGNIYRNFALTLSCKIEGTTPTEAMLDFPNVEDGIRGMAFIDNVVASSQSDKKWTPYVI